MVNFEDLTPLMQMLIKYNMVPEWVEADNKHNNTIHGFSWGDKAEVDTWNDICDELQIMGDKENAKEYLDVEHKDLEDNLKYTTDYEDVELTPQESEHIEEIRDMFPEYQV